MKRYANKVVRQLHRRGGGVPDGKRYKRLLNSYNICDWRYVYLRPKPDRRIREQYARPWQAYTK